MIDRQLHSRAKDILADALQMRPEDRQAYVVDACASDVPLLEEVLSLLKFAGEENLTHTGGIMNAARDRLEAMMTPETVADPSSQASGLRRSYSTETPVSVGKYRISRLIGEGGMGRVFEAVQEKPRRRVALKLIRSSHGGDAVLRRFEYEAQTLGRLEYPGIARIYEAGSDEVILNEAPRIVGGPAQPFIAMELIEGDRLDHYADRLALTIHDRLRLFEKVCRAVSQAHTSGVIHRDLKPSNILVTSDGTPKILDFGIARAVEDQDAGLTMTHAGQPIGTPAYMSPEQADGRRDVDTRSDVYSLGVILYELLTGATPFQQQRLTASIAELQRLIREVDPPKPSAAISKDKPALVTGVQAQPADALRLKAQIAGELDWIVMKAIEKDRARRYQSVGELADDVQRYLKGEAVAAAPPSTFYQIQKSVRRHRGVFTAGVLIVLSLVAGVVAFAWQARVAQRERDRAIKAEAETSERADELQKLSDFQAQMLSDADPAEAGRRLSIDVRDRIESGMKKAGLTRDDRAAQLASFSEAWSRVNTTDVALELIKTTILEPSLAAIDRQFSEQSKLNAMLRSAVASRYLDLGLLEEAQAVNDQILELRRETLGDDDPVTLKVIIARCKILTLLGHAADAENILRPMIDKLVKQPGADETLVVMAKNGLGDCLIPQNKFAEAESIFREALAIRRRVQGDDHEDTLMTLGNLAMALRGEGKFAEAEQVNLEGLHRRQRIYGDDHPYTLSSYNNLGVIQLDAGHPVEAAESFRKAAEGRSRIQGENHRDTMLAYNNLAATLNRIGKDEDAEKIQRDILDRLRSSLGPDHPDAIMALSNLVATLIKLSKFDEAEPLCTELVERRERVQGRQSAGAVSAYNIAGYLYSRQAKYAQVEPLLRKALEASSNVWAENHPERLVLMLNLGVVLRNLKRLDESEKQLRDTLDRCRRALGASHPHTLTTIYALGETLLYEKKYAEVAELLTEAQPMFRSAFAQYDNGDLRGILLLLGKAQLSLHEFSAAESALKEAHDLYVSAKGADGPRRFDYIKPLIQLYNEWNTADPGKGHDQEEAQWKSKLPPDAIKPQG